MRPSPGGQQLALSPDLRPTGHVHTVELATAVVVGRQDDLLAVRRERWTHYAANGTGQTEFLTRVEVIYEKVVDPLPRGDEENLVALRQPLRPQVVGGSGDEGSRPARLQLMDPDVELPSILGAEGQLAPVR